MLTQSKVSKASLTSSNAQIECILTPTKQLDLKQVTKAERNRLVALCVEEEMFFVPISTIESLFRKLAQ